MRRYLKILFCLILLMLNRCTGSNAGNDDSSPIIANNFDSEPGFLVSNRSPFVVTPGKEVRLEGLKFSEGMSVFWGDPEVDPPLFVTTVSETEATFTVPETTVRGLQNLTLMSSGRSTNFTLFFGIEGQLPIYTGPEDQMCQGETFINVLGQIKEGTRVCLSAPPPEPPAEYEDCYKDGQHGCIATPIYKAVNTTQIRPENIRHGVVIAGVEGGYPSLDYPLNGAGASPNGNLPPVTSGIAAGTYEYWNSAGIRHQVQVARPGPLAPGTTDTSVTAEGTLYGPFTVLGEPNLTPENIINGATIFGITGTTLPQLPDCNLDGGTSCTATPDFPAINILGVDPLGIRAGKQVAGIDGAMKHCKNGTNLFLYNSLGDPGGMGDPVHMTLDDANGIQGPIADTPFQDIFLCGADNWEYLQPGGTPGTIDDCSSPSDSCIILDKFTDLIWTEVFDDKRWSDAINTCASLDFAGFSSGWRLPTQKEYMQAYIDGITSIMSTNPNMGNLYSPKWTSTSYSKYNLQESYSWRIDLSIGEISPKEKGNWHRFHCVRQL